MAEARQSGESAPSIARRAIEQTLRDRRRKARQDDIAAYAVLCGGSDDDLDSRLEQATLEVLSAPR